MVLDTLLDKSYLIKINHKYVYSFDRIEFIFTTAKHIISGIQCRLNAYNIIYNNIMLVHNTCRHIMVMWK